MMAVAKPDEYLVVRNHSTVNSTLSFSAHKLLGGFQITENKQMVKKLVIPKLIASDCINRLPGTNLNEGFGIATTISDYQAYHELKEAFFLKWLVGENYHKGVIEKKFKKPNFICMGGRITDSLMTPVISRFGNWKIFAVKFNDTIYLFDVKEAKNMNQTWELMSYYGIYFEHLLTQANPDPSNINEFDKVFAINEISLGSHQLLIMSELDAEGKDLEWAEIKLHKTCSPNGLQGKFLKYWAQSIVPGVKTLVIGEHENGILQKIELTTTDALARKFDIKQNDCYDFEDRLLKFISSHFQVNDPKVVKTFSWKDGDDRVNVEEVPARNIPKGMLPPWYIKAVQSASKSTPSKTLPTHGPASKRSRSKTLSTDSPASKPSKTLLPDSPAPKRRRSKALPTDGPAPKRLKTSLTDSAAPKSKRSKTLLTAGPASKPSKTLLSDSAAPKSKRSKTLLTAGLASKPSKTLLSDSAAPKSKRSKTLLTAGPASKPSKTSLTDTSAPKSKRSKTLPTDGSASKSSKTLFTDGPPSERKTSKTLPADGRNRKLRKQK